MGWVGFLFAFQVWPFSQPASQATWAQGFREGAPLFAKGCALSPISRSLRGKGLGEGRGSEGPLNQLLALPGLRGRDKSPGQGKSGKVQPTHPPPTRPPPPVRGKRAAVPKGESREKRGGCSDDGERGETSSRQYHPQSLASSTPPPHCPGVCTRPSLSLSLPPPLVTLLQW